MGLRSFLENLNTGVESSQTFADTAEDLRKQAAQQQLVAQAPDLINQGQYPQLAANMAAAGDNSGLRDFISSDAKKALIDEKMKLAPSTGDVISPELIQSFKNKYGGDEADWAPLLGKKIALGENYGKAIQAGDQFAKTQVRLNAQHADTITMNQEGKQFNVTQNIAKTEKELQDQLAAVNAGTKAFNEKATPASAVLLIRAIIKATGDNRVSDQDINGLALKGLPNKEAELENWLKGNQNQTLNSAQVEELNRLAKSIKEGAQAKTAGILKSTISTFYQGNPQLIIKPDGSVDKKQKAFLQSKGFDVEVNDNGAPVIITNKFEVPQTGVNDKTGQADKKVSLALIEQLAKKDPASAKMATDQLNKIKSSNAIKQMELALKNELGIKE